jgi:hypothetical protein
MKRFAKLVVKGGVIFGGSYYAYQIIKEYEHRNVLSELNKIKLEKIPTRSEQLRHLQSKKEFDILVVGGGATGTGVALVMWKLVLTE